MHSRTQRCYFCSNLLSALLNARSARFFLNLEDFQHKNSRNITDRYDSRIKFPINTQNPCQLFCPLNSLIRPLCMGSHQHNHYSRVRLRFAACWLTNQPAVVRRIEDGTPSSLCSSLEVASHTGKKNLQSKKSTTSEPFSTVPNSHRRSPASNASISHPLVTRKRSAAARFSHFFPTRNRAARHSTESRVCLGLSAQHSEILVRLSSAGWLAAAAETSFFLARRPTFCWCGRLGVSRVPEDCAESAGEMGDEIQRWPMGVTLVRSELQWCQFSLCSNLVVQKMSHEI